MSRFRCYIDKMLEAVLFDLGDTLLHFSRPTATEMVKLVMRPVHDQLAQMGHHPPQFKRYARAMKQRFLTNLVWSYIRRREMLLVEAVWRTHRAMGINMELEPCRVLCHEYMAPGLRTLFVMADHADAMLQRLQGMGLRLGIVSNTVIPGTWIDTALREHGIIKYFEARTYSSEVGFRKPDPRIFRIALDALGVSAPNTLFIGDHVVNDVKAPARIGMRTVLAVHKERIPRTPVRPDHIIRSLEELPAILDGYR